MFKIVKDSYVILLVIEGKMLDSVEFVDILDYVIINFGLLIIFIIGGLFGLSYVVKEKLNLFLFFLKMIFLY